MYRRLCIAVALCVTLLGGNIRAEELAAGIMKYFPGKWEYKAGDGRVLGTVEWKAVVGGKCLAGPGNTDAGAAYSFAGWDPAKKLWAHVWHGEDGQYGRLEISKFEGETYYGEVHVVQGDGRETSAKWAGRVVDPNHFLITERSGDSVTLIHWERIRP